MHWYALPILLIQLFIVPCTRALGILLPLYIYPGTGCDTWSPVSDAISANSNAQWYIVINPDNGPGPTDELYETCVSELPASANQITMGYVGTKGDVLGDIDTYAGWPTSSRPRGIFFDDIVPTTSRLSTYQSYISYARSQGFTFYAGETVEDSAYFSIADLINTYEDSYSSFDPDSLSGTMSQQSVILVKSPATGTYNTVISRLANLGVGAVYISSVSDSSQALPAQLSEFASEIASVGGGTASSGTSASSSSSTASSAPASSKSPSFVTSQSPSLGGASLQTSSAQLPKSSTHSSGPSQTPVTAINKGLPIAAITGAVLGALVILLLLLVIFLCMRHRRRQRVSADAVPYFIEIGNPSLAAPSPVDGPTTATSIVSPIVTSVPLAQSWSVDVKEPLQNLSTMHLANVTETNFSARSSYQITVAAPARLSDAPTYGSAWDSVPGTACPPPAYS
ncbi:hypothetical protein MSAN_02405500 [Mycena sanguinolenta]|uniref:Uncharacterized protein n=1 Tax=Mycena sanguinolenta TaxID=230812 RepID=A0A8H7CEM3_9AGAR|nr:hypothetical protein MSAN_02405500 [Mycena sanguinolenta]